jgi:protein deglycase
MATILTILPEGFEELEAVAPVDLWRRAGFKVTIAALGSKKLVTGRNGIEIQTETTLGGVGPDRVFDVLFLPGGPGVEHLRSSPDVREIVGRQVAAGKMIAAICAAPLVLKDAGLLVGRKYTAHPSTETELNEIIADQPVVVDGSIVTSQGAGTAVDFGLKIIELLTNAERAAEISLSICAKAAS